ARLDRRHPRTLSGPAHLYLLEIFPECIRAERRASYRSLSFEPRRCRTANGGRRGSGAPRLAQDQRSCPGLDRTFPPLKVPRVRCRTEYFLEISMGKIV